MKNYTDTSFDKHYIRILRNDKKQADKFLKNSVREYNKTNDVKILMKTIRVLVQVKGWDEIAKKIGVKRQSLIQSLSEKGNPTIKTLSQVSEELGLKIGLTFA
ncbi:MAG: helix-turn-helix domain-containing transcriptional regulator [Alphaproteobacteria bacterium]